MMPAPMRSNPPPELVGGDKATGRQLALVESLLAEREIPPKDGKTGAERRSGAMKILAADEYTKKTASDVINWLRSLPRRHDTEKHDGWPAIPNGRYALAFPDDELNPVRFYKISTGKGERWEGFRFVERFVSDDTFPVKGADRDNVLNRIVNDQGGPLEAARLYGVEMRRCCICNRKLTRGLSRALGIGPVCGGRTGWLTDEMIDSMRRQLENQGIDPDKEVENA